MTKQKTFTKPRKNKTQVYTAHTNHSSVFARQEFDAYLKLDDGTKIHLLTSRKKQKLTTVVATVASFLNIPVQDNSGT